MIFSGFAWHFLIDRLRFFCKIFDESRRTAIAAKSDR